MPKKRRDWKRARHAAQWDTTLRTYCTFRWSLDVTTIDALLLMNCLKPIWTAKTETASRLRGRTEWVPAWATDGKNSIECRFYPGWSIDLAVAPNPTDHHLLKSNHYAIRFVASITSR